MSRTRRFAATMIGLGLVVVLAACGSSEPGAATSAEIDVRTLDIGGFAVDPLDIHEDNPPGLTDTPQIGGLRISDYTVNAYDVDPRMNVGMTPPDMGTFESGVMSERLGNSDAVSAIAKREDMYFGFETIGFDRQIFIDSTEPNGWPSVDAHNSTGVDLIVMQFPDAGAATRAAGEFADAESGIDKTTAAFPLPKYPAARAQWRPGIAELRSYLAHGSYVAAVLAFAPTADPTTLTALAQKTYDTELPVLDTLPPISDEDVMSVSWDPEYLISRTLNAGQNGRLSFGDENAAFTLRGIMNYMPDRATAATTFAAIKGQKFARTDDALLVRTADAASAAKAVHDRLTPEKFLTPAQAVPKLPDSACVQNTSEQTFPSDRKRFTCIVAYRNYVGYVNSDQLIDVQQRAAAQYALLADSTWEP